MMTTWLMVHATRRRHPTAKRKDVRRNGRPSCLRASAWLACLQGWSVAVPSQAVCYRSFLPAVTASRHGLLHRRLLRSHAQRCRGYRQPGPVFAACRLWKSIGILPKGAYNYISFTYQCYSWKRFRLSVSILLSFRGLSVLCLSVPFVHCAQTAEDINTISFAYDSHVSPRLHKYLAYIGQPFLLKFCPKLAYPCWFERQRHSMANCGRLVKDSALVTMESLYRKPVQTTIASLNGTIADPLRPPFLPNMSPKCTYQELKELPFLKASEYRAFKINMFVTNIFHISAKL